MIKCVFQKYFIVLFLSVFLTHLNAEIIPKTNNSTKPQNLTLPLEDKKTLKEYSPAPHKAEEKSFIDEYLSLMDLNGLYILPFYHSFTPVYGNNQQNEMKIQISFKIPVFRQILGTKGSIYFAYTQTMWFQAYNIKYSNPMRDTNYQPEIYYSYALDWNLFGGKLSSAWIGVQHFSNGIGGDICYKSSLREASGPLCRSRTAGNRLLAHIFWQKGDFQADLSVWPYIPKRKDNLDLYQYMGYGNLKLSYRKEKHLAEIEINPIFTDYSRYKGSIRLGYTFKVSKFLGIYMQYFYGYGDSLYEYNILSNRFGIGVRMLP